MSLISGSIILLVIFILISSSCSTMLYFPKSSTAEEPGILSEPVMTHSSSVLAIVNCSERTIFPSMYKINENQTITQPWLRFEGVNFLPDITKLLILKETEGFLVTGVIPGTLAHKAVVQRGENSTLANIHGAKMNPLLGKTPDFLIYENSDLGVNIKYPSNWKKEAKYASAVDFISPKEKNSDRYLENLGLQVSSLSQHMTLDEFTSHQIDFLNQSFPSFKIIDSRDTTLGGNPAHKVAFSYGVQQNIPLFKIIEIWMIMQNKVYIITSGAEFNKYSIYIPIIQKMIDSFELSTFLTYQNSILGVKLQYPSNWKRAESNNNITFIPQLVNSSDRHHAKFIISVKGLFQNETLGEYSNGLIKKLKDNSPNIRILEAGPTNLAGNPAYKAVFTNGLEGQDSLKTMEVWTLSDHKSYLIQYSSEAEKYPKYLATIEKMINSFEFNIGEQFVGSGIPAPILPPLGIPLDTK
jgi:hypothetical protein